MLIKEEGIPTVSNIKDELYNEALTLLKRLISIESFSEQENKSVNAISDFFTRKRISHQRKESNIWAFNKYFNPQLPTILLNAHHDRSRPAFGWSANPFLPLVENGKLYGLGSNDSGAALVSLIATFLYFNEYENLKYNLIFASTENAQVRGNNGIKIVLPKLGEIDFAIVSEPTKMHLVIAEKELMVLDCVAKVKSGLKVEEDEENAIDKALKDINWFRSYKFLSKSDFSKPIKMLLTHIESINTDNKIPEECKYTIEIKREEKYDKEELLNFIRQNTSSEIKVRPTILKPALLDKSHPIVSAGTELGRNILSSHSVTDDSLIEVPSLIIGPGDPARSNTSDEFIYLAEINEGINIYIDMIKKVVF